MAFAVRDLFKQPLNAEEIRNLAGRIGAAALFSWRSPTARQRGIAPGSRTDEELIALMAEEPRLIRRPLTVSRDAVIIGADVQRLAALTCAPPAPPPLPSP